MATRMEKIVHRLTRKSADLLLDGIKLKKEGDHGAAYGHIAASLALSSVAGEIEAVLKEEKDEEAKQEAA